MHRILRKLPACALLALSLASVKGQDLDSRVPVFPERNAYFGDLHLHTSNSYDAAWGGARTTRDDAYNYAKGHPVTYLGHEVKRKAPLDFLAIADHAEYMGVAMQIVERHRFFRETDWVERMFTEQGEPGSGFRSLLSSGFYGPEVYEELNTREVKEMNWQAVIEAADRHNAPGSFTAFAAFEWSNTPGGSHYHRVAIFPGPAYPAVPFSALDSRDPVDLWRYADNQRADGIDSILIPHNMNLSGGLHFSYNDQEGRPMDRAYAEMKIRNETLVEITQIKGTSETHPELSPNDEFAGFEIIDHYVQGERQSPDGSYARQGLRRGLEIQERVGVNPYKYGFVGSSDYHSSTTATEEFNHTGALGSGDNPFREDKTAMMTNVNPVLNAPTTDLAASGLAGVWAEQNTREAIFAALKRRETFATSGPRIQVRMFAGWDYDEGLVHRNDWLSGAYAGGVSMGGDLHNNGSGRSPRFLLHALKDPDSGNLDRIQVVKVWERDGESFEKVFDAVWAGDREPDPVTGKVPSVGNTVDVASASYTNTIGAAELSGEWSDPEFDPGDNAAYYARVIEIPTPRWPVYLAVRNKLPVPDTSPTTHQERAWTSPIFYNP